MGKELWWCGHHEIEGEGWQRDGELDELNLGIASNDGFIAFSSNGPFPVLFTLVNKGECRNLRA